MEPHGKPSTLPKTFRSLSALRALNVAAMGLSLAVATGSVFAHLLGGSTQFGTFGVTVGLPTLLVGVAWALLLRLRATVANTRLRWGWIASIPLAMINGALAGGLFLAADGHGEPIEKFFLGGVLGLTFGAIFWIPGLVATVGFFGAPVAWSQKLAAQGLAGEERGERVVGIASTLLALLGVALTAAGNAPSYVKHPWLDPLGLALLFALGIAGAVAGVAATALAHAREQRRRRFVSEVAEGKVAGYRVDAAPEGKVLVRVTSMGEGYRVANFEEEVYALDEAGEAKKELFVGRAGPFA